MALVRRGGGKFIDVAKRCEDAGAAAVILANTEEELFATTTGDSQARPVDIPVVVVCSQTMRELRHRMQHGTIFVSIKPQVVRRMPCVSAARSPPVAPPWPVSGGL